MLIPLQTKLLQRQHEGCTAEILSTMEENKATAALINELECRGYESSFNKSLLGDLNLEPRTRRERCSEPLG